MKFKKKTHKRPTLDSPPRPRRDTALAWALALAVLAVYARTVSFDFVLTDDPTYVAQNPRVLGGPTAANLAWAFTTFEASNWHPLTWISLMLDARLGGGAAWAFHATNLALHVANTLLVFWLLLAMTRAAWNSAAVAALFGLHPLHVESVAWISERKDVLSAFFGLAALLAWVGYTRRPAAVRYLLVVLLFAASLLAKPMLVTLPFVLLLLDDWPLERREADGPAFRRYRILEKLPLLALSAASSWVTLAAQREVIGTLLHFPLGLRVQNAVVAYAVYLRRIVWPSDLALPYPYDPALAPLTVLAAAALLSSITALVVWRRRERYLSVGWLWFLGTLVPVAGLVQVGIQPLADRYTYLPLIGPFVMLVWGLAQRPGLEGRRGWPPVLATGAGLALAALSVTTCYQVGHWRDSRALFVRALAVTDNNVLAHSGFATVLTEEGRTDEAIAQYRKALGIDPRAGYARIQLAELLVSASRLDEASRELETALTHAPASAQEHVALGNLLARRGDSAAAIEHFRQAGQLAPNSAGIQVSLAIALMQQSRVDEARAALEEALRIDPRHAVAHKRMGVLLYRQSRLREAIGEFEQSLRLDPRQTDLQRDLDQLRQVEARGGP